MLTVSWRTSTHGIVVGPFPLMYPPAAFVIPFFKQVVSQTWMHKVHYNSNNTDFFHQDALRKNAWVAATDICYKHFDMWQGGESRSRPLT